MSLPEKHPQRNPRAPKPSAGTTQPPAALVPSALDVPAPGPAPETCPRCGAIDVPTLSAGSGPHACKASCAHCGRFLRWVSLLAPSERMAHRLKARLEAMRKHPASAAQLALLLALGDTQAAPKDMAEASERIEVLKTATAARNTTTLGGKP